MTHLSADPSDDYENPPGRKSEEEVEKERQADVEKAGVYDGVWRYPASMTGPLWWVPPFDG